MTIEEVAEYLRVSERTVYDWAQKGEIPGGKLGTAWRFKREDMERWVNSRLSEGGGRRASGGASIARLLTPERVLLLEAAGKAEVLNRLVDLLATTPLVKDREKLLKGILDREELMSTGIGVGIGVPHVRIDSVSDLVMAVAVCRRPIAGYSSLDEQPVQIVCMLAARRDQHAQYIRTLSAISARLKDRLTRERIIHADTPADVHAILTAAEPA